MSSKPPLAIVPSYARRPQQLRMLAHCLHTLRATADCDVVVVDDGSPLEGSVGLALDVGAGGVLTDNRGFSSAVNEGLRLARSEGRDAVLVNSDIEFKTDGWLQALEAGKGDVVGALLVYPHGLVQHAGAGYSAFNRGWDHRFRYAPFDLPAVHEPRTCPVTAALSLVRLSALEQVGLYDEDFALCFEDVDYCLRTFEAGLSCAYQPKAIAIHHEMMSRGDGIKMTEEAESRRRLFDKHPENEMRRWQL